MAVCAICDGTLDRPETFTDIVHHAREIQHEMNLRQGGRIAYQLPKRLLAGLSYLTD